MENQTSPGYATPRSDEDSGFVTQTPSSAELTDADVSYAKHPLPLTPSTPIPSPLTKQVRQLSFDDPVSKGTRIGSVRRLRVKVEDCGRRFDVLTDLCNHPTSVDLILKGISDADLQNVYRVSSSHRSLVIGNRHANRRRLAYLRKRWHNKENESSQTKGKDSERKRKVFSQSSQTSLEVRDRSPSMSPRTKRLHSFIEAADSTNELRCCLQCKQPSKLNSGRFVCTIQDCGYTFCRECSCEYSDGHVCLEVTGFSPSREVPAEGRAGRKRTRKALKRLLFS